MNFLNWLVVHTLCLVGFISIYIIANKTIFKLNKWTKKVSHILLFAAIAFYVFGYITPINPFAMIILAYITVLICLAIQKCSIKKVAKDKSTGSLPAKE